MLVSGLSHFLDIEITRPWWFRIFFEILNPGCFVKNPYKPPIFFLDSYSPTHKLSKSPINGLFSSKKNITGWSPLETIFIIESLPVRLQVQLRVIHYNHCFEFEQYFKRKIAKAMKDDTEFGQNFRSAVNGFLTKINRMTKTRLSWVFRQATD